jgi:hypothetical protein
MLIGKLCIANIYYTRNEMHMALMCFHRLLYAVVNVDRN